MKKITLLLLTFVLTFIFSCDSDDDTPEATYKLVKVVYLNSDDLIEGTNNIEYNSNGFISKTIETSNTGTNTTNYIYNNGKIISIISDDISSNFTYTDELITSSTSQESGAETHNYIYTYNPNNQVIKQVESTQSSSTEYETTYTYDSNNNVLTETYDSLLGNTYTYDSKKNPLKLVLTEALLKIYTFGDNNKTSEDSNFIYTYEYNEGDYPTKMSEFYNGELQAYNLYTYEEI